MAEEKFYPEGDALEAQITWRHRQGLIWRTLFVAALLAAIVSLVALLVTIVNDSFGYVVVVSRVDPERLTLDVLEEQLLGTANTVSSEDDHELAEGIVADPDGTGYFGIAYYVQNQADLQLVSVDGVLPDQETAASGDYPLTRPLYLYTSASALANNQAANIFLNYLLTHVNEEIDSVGYFPVNNELLSMGQNRWLAANSDLGLQPGQWATINPAGSSGNIAIAGSSTVNPLTQHMLEQFQVAGYRGSFTNESLGSTAGLIAFCSGQADIAAASRPIQSGELELCRENGRFPLEFHIGTDALAIVVNRDNSFVSNVSREDLQQIYASAATWSEVNPSWPDTTIKRYIPGADSGTLDFFTEAVFETTLADLPQDDLVRMLAANISVGRGRALEREQRFYESALVFESPEVWNEVCASEERPLGCTSEPRSQSEIYDLVVQEVVQPDVVKTYQLSDSLLQRRSIAQEVAQQYPNGKLEFRSWLTANFVTDPQSSTPEFAGVRTAILGSLWVIGITVLFSFPIGVGAAIYLEEYAADNRLNRLLQTNINNLAGVPSIIYGILGLAVFVRALEILTSGAVFGAVESTASANGRTILSAGLTLGLLILPLLIINAQEAIRAVPISMRQAGMALGATKWQTTWHHVLPSALPGILTGTILSISRALGETAPLVVVGASTFITVDPSSPFAKFTTLPIQIYQWTSRPQAEFRHIAAAAIVVLLVMLLSLNTTSIYLRNRYSRRV
jgi:phosphate transport system permease protein